MPLLAEKRCLPRTHVLQDTRDFFDRIAGEWDNMRHADAEHIEKILARAKVPQGGRILDVACGTGILFEALLRREPDLLRAIDISERMVAIAQQKFAGTQVVVTAEDFYAFEQEDFDCAVVYNAYPHFLDKALFGQKAALCLKPGGRLVIAHGCGRQQINAKHKKSGAEMVSDLLRSCEEEAARLKDYFLFDVMEDAGNCYILAGTAR